jgi:signal transduction histidine kinase
MDLTRFLELAQWAGRVVWPTGLLEPLAALVVFLIAVLIYGSSAGFQKVLDKIRWWHAGLLAYALYYGGFKVVSAASAPEFPYPDSRQPLIQFVFIVGILIALVPALLLAWFNREKQEPESPLLLAQRRLREMESRVRQMQGRYLPQTRREQVDGELLRITHELRDAIHAELRQFLASATAERILPTRERWRDIEGRLTAPPFELLGKLADAIRELADDLRDHDLRNH